jgi:hypoxanthine phosphoribosyltransferase
MIKYENLYLYSNIKADNRFKLKFTFLKFGDPGEVEFFGNKLLKQIKTDHDINELKENYLIAAPPTILECTATNLIRDYLRGKLQCPAVFLSKQKPFKYYSFIGSRQARKKIIHGYRMRLAGPKHLNNKKIILIDDALASGCTINEVARVLFKAGAKEIYTYIILKIDSKNLSAEGKIYDIAVQKNIKRSTYLLNQRIITSTMLKHLIKLEKSEPAKFKKIISQVKKSCRGLIVKSVNQYKLSSQRSLLFRIK